jgi:hypothetical protein
VRAFLGEARGVLHERVKKMRATAEKTD